MKQPMQQLVWDSLFIYREKRVTDFDVKSYISECFNCRQMQDWKNWVKSEVMTWRGSTKGVLDSRVNWRQPVN